MTGSPATDRSRTLGACHGYVVVSEDGPVGDVETPVFAAGSDQPAFLIVRTFRPPFRRRGVSTSLVREVDAAHRLVFLAVSSDEVASLPEHFPLAEG